MPLGNISLSEKTKNASMPLRRQRKYVAQKLAIVKRKQCSCEECEDSDAAGTLLPLESSLDLVQTYAQRQLQLATDTGTRAGRVTPIHSCHRFSSNLIDRYTVSDLLGDTRKKYL